MASFIQYTIKLLKSEIQKDNKDTKLIETLESSLASKDSIKLAIDEPIFYTLPFDNIVSITKKINFNESPNCQELLQKLIQKSTEKYGNQAISILNFINCEKCNLPLDFCLSLLHNFKDCQLFTRIIQLTQNVEEEEEEAPSKYPPILTVPDDLPPTVIEAVIEGKLDSVRYYLEIQGLDKEKLYGKGFTLLQSACLSKQPHIVKYLIEETKCNVNASFKGHLPIHLACIVNCKEIIDYLVDNNYQNIESKNNEGETPLLICSEFGLFDVVKYIIENKHADINQLDKNGLNVLTKAAISGNLELVRYLVDNCHCDINYGDENGFTALHRAAMKGHLDIVKYFIDEKGMDYDLVDVNNCTPAMHAINNGKIDIIRYLVDVKGANISRCDSNGNTFLHCAAALGQIEIMKYLIEEKHVDINSRNNLGCTALHSAAKYNELESCVYLISFGLDKNALDNEGKTPCQLASNPIIQEFLEPDYEY